MSFVVQGLFFNEVVRIYEQGNKALTNSLRSLSMEKAVGNIFLHLPPTQLIRV